MILTPAEGPLHVEKSFHKGNRFTLMLNVTNYGILTVHLTNIGTRCIAQTASVISVLEQNKVYFNVFEICFLNSLRFDTSWATEAFLIIDP